MEKHVYVGPGKHHIQTGDEETPMRELVPGEVVELNKRQARAFADRFRPAESVLAPPEKVEDEGAEGEGEGAEGEGEGGEGEGAEGGEKKRRRR